MTRLNRRTRRSHRDHPAAPVCAAGTRHLRQRREASRALSGCARIHAAIVVDAVAAVASAIVPAARLAVSEPANRCRRSTR
eukprot:6194804-Pleurochrysis_carterae.AAC.3